MDNKQHLGDELIGQQSSEEHAADEFEEAEDDAKYSVDHLSAVVRPVALTMILAR